MYPKTNVAMIEATVSKKPSLPVDKVSLMFIPKPSPIIAIFNNQLTAFVVKEGKGVPKKYVNKNPPTNATGLVIYPDRLATIHRMNAIFVDVCFKFDLCIIYS